MVHRVRLWGSFVLVLVLTVVSTACGLKKNLEGIDDFGIRGSGTLVTRSFDLRGFTAIQLGWADFQAEIVQSPTFAVSVTTDDNLVDHLDVNVQGDTLVVDLHVFADPSALRVNISMPDIQRLNLTWGGYAHLGVFEPSASFQVETSMGGTVTGSVVTGRFDAKISGGQLELSGSAKDATLVADVGRLKLDSFAISTARVSLSGRSTGDVYVTGRLANAVASGGSFLSYRGNPELGSITALDTSRIVRVD